jgi:hypothetical protein
MTTFSYKVEATSQCEAIFVANILQNHGLLYPWTTDSVGLQVQGGYIRIIVDSVKDSGQIVTDDKHSGEVILTIDPVILKDLGLSLSSLAEDNSQHGYIISEKTRIELPQIALPVPIGHFGGIACFGSWSPEYSLIVDNIHPIPVVVSRSRDGVRQIVVAVNLLAFMDDTLLGFTPAGSARLTQWEDWAEVYGIGLTQSRALTPFIDQFLRLLRDLVESSCCNAFPIEIDYYPPGATAPLLLTGDSDNSTSDNLLRYLRTVELHKAKATILIKDFSSFSREILEDALRCGHSFGIHPYSAGGGEQEYAGTFNRLVHEYQLIFQQAPCVGRNHRFQWVGRTLTVDLEAACGVMFDLNCVSANGSAWLGSASGVGFPSAFPPRAGVFNPFPMHLPTVLEDDVLQYPLDYCYKPFISGDGLAVDVGVAFLSAWILGERCPAVVNLHPEHIKWPHSRLLNSILTWAIANNVWVPNIVEFGNWIRHRGTCSIEVQQQTDCTIILMRSPVALRVKPSAMSPHKWQWTVAHPGKSVWRLDRNRSFRDLIEIAQEDCHEHGIH